MFFLKKIERLFFQTSDLRHNLFRQAINLQRDNALRAIVVECSQSRGEALPQAEEFTYLGVVFMSNGWRNGRWIGALFALMRALVPVCLGDERAKPKGETFDILACLHSNLHLWSWGADPDWNIEWMVEVAYVTRYPGSTLEIKWGAPSSGVLRIEPLLLCIKKMQLLFSSGVLPTWLNYRTDNWQKIDRMDRLWIMQALIWVNKNKLWFSWS